MSQPLLIKDDENVEGYHRIYLQRIQSTEKERSEVVNLDGPEIIETHRFPGNRRWESESCITQKDLPSKTTYAIWAASAFRAISRGKVLS